MFVCMYLCMYVQDLLYMATISHNDLVWLIKIHKNTDKNRSTLPLGVRQNSFPDQPHFSPTLGERDRSLWPLES